MTTNRTWPDGYMGHLWAKSADKGEGGQPETLATHTWLVLEKLAALIHLRPNLPKQIGVPRLWHVLFWATFLHDFGKVAPGFQMRLRGGEKWPHRHEVLSLAFVRVGQVFNWFRLKDRKNGTSEKTGPVSPPNAKERKIN